MIWGAVWWWWLLWTVVLIVVTPYLWRFGTWLGWRMRGGR
jgi:hypothetical protein